MTMTNELGQVRCVVRIYTERGTISVECAPGGTNVSYHYKPLSAGDPYYNGSLNNLDQIQQALYRSWIEPISKNVEQIEKAIRAVRAMVCFYDERQT